MPPHPATSFAERYDRALQDHRYDHLPPDYPAPHPTADWPPENLAFLEQYRRWLLEGGASELVTHLYYLPMAGHVCGLTLKRHDQLDPDADLHCAQAYIEAKGLSPSWTKNCRNALVRLRGFLRYQRGLGETHAVTPFDVAAHTQDLPTWLVNELQRYQRLQQRNWRPARLDQSIRRFWSCHLRMWRFFCEQRGVQQLADLRRQQVFDYVDARLDTAHSVSGVNGDVHTLRGFLIFLQEEGYPVPQALLRLKGLKPAETLPKFLPDEQVKKLRDEIERAAAQAVFASQRRDALLTRAAFYLLWQGGLRLGEVEELRLEDLELAARRLTVRNGKLLKDRTVYLAVRGPGTGDHVFLYRNQPLRKDLIRAHIQIAGQHMGVKVYPHRLRHTCATQLLNAGCRVTSIQRFLGHKKLNSTMIYAKVHDQTVADDYFAAMTRVEARLELTPVDAPSESKPAPAPDRAQLLAITDQLTAPELDLALRLALVAQIQALLRGQVFPVSPLENCPSASVAANLFGYEGANLTQAASYPAAGP